MDIVSLIVCLTAVVIALGSLFQDKMIGIELLLSCQTIYFFLATVKNNPIELTPFIKAIRYTNGYNTIQEYEYFRYQPLPDQLNHIFYEKEYLLNVNVMLALLWLIFIMLVIVRIVTKCNVGTNSTAEDSPRL
jgi:hypothetical protein